MQPEPIMPGLDNDLVRMHIVISRGIDMARQVSQYAAERGFAGEKERVGFFSYLRVLGIVMDVHHRAEEEVAFPMLRSHMPEVPLLDLSEQHEKLEKLLEDMRMLLNDLRLRKHEQISLQVLGSTLRELLEVWEVHRVEEENRLSQAHLEECLTPEEYSQLTQRIARFTQEHAQPDFLVVPFILYNLPASERLVEYSRLPHVVTQELLQTRWREKWEPMLPYLLV